MSTTEARPPHMLAGAMERHTDEPFASNKAALEDHYLHGMPLTDDERARIVQTGGAYVSREGLKLARFSYFAPWEAYWAQRNAEDFGVDLEQYRGDLGTLSYMEQHSTWVPTACWESILSERMFKDSLDRINAAVEQAQRDDPERADRVYAERQAEDRRTRGEPT